MGGRAKLQRLEMLRTRDAARCERGGNGTRRDVTTSVTPLILCLPALPSEGSFRSAHLPSQMISLLPIGDASSASRCRDGMLVAAVSLPHRWRRADKTRGPGTAMTQRLRPREQSGSEP